MIARRIFFAALPIGAVALACSDDAVDSKAPPPIDDASADTSAPDVTDATTPEIVTPDAGPPKPLEVVCTEEPCYVAVSGNDAKHTCGLLKSGTVKCWGEDDGALGRGDRVSALEGATPQPVVDLEGVTQISVGSNLGTCARTADGAAYCWGRNDFGQLGRPSTETRLFRPTRVEGLPPIDEIAIGIWNTCAIASADHALYCWGSRTSTIGRSVAPPLVPDAGGDAKGFAPQVMTGFRPPVRGVVMTGRYDDTVVVMLEGNVLASLGDAPAGESSLPQPSISKSPRELPGVVRAGALAYVSEDGLLERWLPEKGLVYVPSPATVVQVAISGATLQGGALLASGRLFRWGLNTAGTLGVSPESLPFTPHPVEVTSTAGGFTVSFATTKDATCASLEDGKIKCWGANLHGELGRGTIDSMAHPEAEVIR